VTDSNVGASAPSELAHAFVRLRNAEFPWTAEATYLNNASIGPLPERTRGVVDAFTAKRTAPYQLPDKELQGVLREARRTVARLLNADVEEIALATNTSFGLNIAATSLPIAPGETVLVSDKEFPANVYPWLLLRERGVDVELAPVSAEGWPSEGYLLERLRGTYLVVDAIQALGQVPLDVRQTPVDVLACGAQKWLLSPWGSGFVYVRRELIPTLKPVMAGWFSFEGTGDFSRLTEYNTTFLADARRFEAGTLPFQDVAGMAESIGMLLEFGIDRIAAYLRELRRPLLAAAAEGAIGLCSPTDEGHASSIVCVKTENVAESYHALRQAGVVGALREGSIRLSPHCYNTVDELERVVDILRGP
jgi:selenocysteine lyase/cysteine desulfurase